MSVHEWCGFEHEEPDQCPRKLVTEALFASVRHGVCGTAHRPDEPCPATPEQRAKAGRDLEGWLR